MVDQSPHLVLSIAGLPCTPGISCQKKRDWAKLASSTHFNNGYQMKGVYIHRCVCVYSCAHVCKCSCKPSWQLYFYTQKTHNLPLLTTLQELQLHLFSLPFSPTCSLPFQNKMNQATAPSRGLLFLDAGWSPRRKSLSNINTFWYKEHLFRHS